MISEVINLKLRWTGLLVCVSCFVCCSLGTAFARNAISDVAFIQLTQKIQNELDSRHHIAQRTDEIFPGATVAFILADGRIAEFATGYSDMETKAAMLPYSRMPVGSIGKTFVAAVVLKMVSEGVLDLDSNISKWLGDEPWFDRLPNKDAITLRHLLNHSSGLIDHVFDVESGFQSYLKQKLSPDNIEQAFHHVEFVNFVLDRKPLFPAGAGFHYSDTGYILAGIIIEKVSTASYYHEISRRFIKPLGLIHTSALNERDAAGVAQGYATKGQQLFGFPAKILHKGSFVFDSSLEWTGGGLISTSKDLVRWAKALYGGTIIDVNYLNEMLNSVANPERGQDDSGRKYGYGLGVSVARTEYGTVLRHGGFFPGYNSFLAFYPDRGIAVAMQINTDDSSIEEHFNAIVKIIIDFASKQ